MQNIVHFHLPLLTHPPFGHTISIVFKQDALLILYIIFVLNNGCGCVKPVLSRPTSANTRIMNHKLLCNTS